MAADVKVTRALLQMGLGAAPPLPPQLEGLKKLPVDIEYCSAAN